MIEQPDEDFDSGGYYRIVLRICSQCLLMIEHTHLDTDDVVPAP